MNYRQLNGKTIRQGFNEFHEENPQVYKSFEEQALKAIEKGRKKLSAKLIINWIRWNEVLRTSDENFKIMMLIKHITLDISLNCILNIVKSLTLES